MPAECIQLLNNWQETLPARRCECGVMVLDASPGQPCESCRMDLEEQETCPECGGEKFVRSAGHWADEMGGWRPCPACGDCFPYD